MEFLTDVGGSEAQIEDNFIQAFSSLKNLSNAVPKIDAQQIF